MKRMLDELGLKEGQVFRWSNPGMNGGKPLLFKFGNNNLYVCRKEREDWYKAPLWVLISIHEDPSAIETGKTVSCKQRDWLRFVYANFDARWLTMDLSGDVCSWSKRPWRGIAQWLGQGDEAPTVYRSVPCDIKSLVGWHRESPLNIADILFCNGLDMIEEA